MVLLLWAIGQVACYNDASFIFAWSPKKIVKLTKVVNL
jgi:hypothetical protein